MKSTEKSKARDPIEVTYRITGTARDASIHCTHPQGGSETSSSVPLPWEKSYIGAPGALLSVSADGSSAGDLRVEILINGRTARESSAKGPYAHCSCHMFLDTDNPGLSPSGTSMLGGVYMLKSGRFYKIGKAMVIDKRIRQIDLQLPEPVEVIHKIYTHNIDEVELYWHRHFADKRKGGEWFDLTDEDVAKFKRHTEM